MGILKLLILTIVCGSIKSYADKCPENYKRISTTHTFCLPQNTSCNIIKSGINEATRRHILDVHNKYRSRVAMGLEDRAGGLPQASNMMQMEWDDELAAIAQKWASNCNYKHDCHNCRDVPNFPVNQNIGRTRHYCMAKIVQCEKNLKEDWDDLFYDLYDKEIIHFNKNTIEKFTSAYTTVNILHFTQMIWAETWRVGCGYVYFEDYKSSRKSGTHFYVCNYGPKGNSQGLHMYKPGPPCSACPTNTCCGRSCGQKNYPGLCKMNDPETAPMYPKANKHYIFYCDFNENGPDCNHKVNGRRWDLVEAPLSGNYLSVQLPKGETVLEFTKTLNPLTLPVCLHIYYRKRAEIYGERDVSVVSLNYEVEGVSKRSSKLPVLQNPAFFNYNARLGWAKPTKISLSFSVPPNSIPHILEVKKIFAYEGVCKR